MQVSTVTFTGADDSISPRDLLPISELYPEVEWGILFSRSNAGRPRYPSTAWLEELGSAWIESHRLKWTPLNLSAHLCGHYVRQLVTQGVEDWWREHEYMRFRRVQLNFHAQWHKVCAGFPVVLKTLSARHQFIFQVDGCNDASVLSWVRDGLGVPLFDTSGGAGVVPGSWPEAIPGRLCGYAGGLGPETIAEELPKILAASDKSRIWIDMERRVRSQDDTKFDLDKCRQVLEYVYGRR